MKKTDFSSKKRLFIIFLAFGIVLSLITSINERIFFKNNIKDIALKNAVQKTIERESVFKNFLSEASNTLSSIKSLAKFNEYLLTNSESSKKDLEDIFLTYSKSQPTFMQLRYIDENGMERIRVDRDRIDSEPKIINENNLQDKSKRYYFLDSKRKPLDEVWFSAFDLNIEKDRVQIPFKPTLRAVYPIKKNDKFGGILIINYYMNSFAKIFMNTPLYNMILCDSRGYSLLHYDEKKSWGVYRRPNYDISQEFKIEYRNILNSESLEGDNFVSRKLNLPIANQLFLIIQVKESFINKLNTSSNYKYLTNSLITLLATLFLTIFITKFFSETILDLKRLNKLNENLNTASKVAKIGFWEYTSETDELKWSDGTYELFDLKKLDFKITLEKFFTFIPPDEKEKVSHEYEISISEKRDYFIVHKIITRKNKIKYVEERAKHYYDKNGKFIKSLGSVIDVTDYYKQQDKLKNFNDRFELITNGLNEGIWDWDIKTGKTFYSKRGKNILGYEDKDIENNIDSFYNLVNIDDLTIVKNSIRKHFVDPLKNPYSVEIRLKCKDENYKWVAIRGRAYFDESNKPTRMLGFIYDITEERKNKENLKEKNRLLEEQSKLASMGQLIGNISHQWRQPLSVITGAASTLQVKLDLLGELTKEEILDIAELILNQSNYLSNTIDDFRNFIKEDKSFIKTKLSTILESTFNIVNPTLKNNYIKLIVDIEDDIEFYGNKNELQQAFMNIINNSKDALVENIVDDDQRYIFITSKKIGEDKLELKFKDSGGGIPNDILDNIFEPYFTTKHQSIGTGLGLSMTHKIITERHKQTIIASNETYTYNNQTYKGASFKVIIEKNEDLFGF